MKTLLAWLHAQHCPYADLREILNRREHWEAMGFADLAEEMPALSHKTKKMISSFRTGDQVNALQKRCMENETRMVLYGDADYPARLYEIDEPPPVLYVRGKGRFPSQPAIAIVGSRRTTQYGLRATGRIARSLAGAGIAVISGFAEGIDTAAHRAALKTGETIAVLGCGMDWIYPKSNVGLYGQVAESGVLITEFPFGEKPYGYHFPFRNRVISGLADGIVLIEGTHKSGAMTTIRHGLDQGKMIYALPGDVDRKTSEGPNQLIFEGAEPLLDLDQILEAFAKRQGDEVKAFPDGLTPKEETVLRLLDQEPMGIEKICNLSNLPIHDIVSVLTSLELYGYAIRQGNHYYRPRR